MKFLISSWLFLIVWKIQHVIPFPELDHGLVGGEVVVGTDSI